VPPPPPPPLTVHPHPQPPGLLRHRSGVPWTLLRSASQAHGPQGTTLDLPWHPQTFKMYRLTMGKHTFSESLRKSANLKFGTQLAPFLLQGPPNTPKNNSLGTILHPRVPNILQHVTPLSARLLQGLPKCATNDPTVTILAPRVPKILKKMTQRCAPEHTEPIGRSRRHEAKP
jgi:hypothetical protein